MSMPNDLDRAWAGGLFEGEGCVGSHGLRNRHGRQLGRLQLVMCDEEIVERFADIMGCGRIYVRKPKDDRRWQYGWQTTKIAEFEHCAEVLRPFLGTRRLAALDAAIERQNLPGVPHVERWANRRKGVVS